MTSWMKERDRLVEQTMAFVEGVASQRPMRVAVANVGNSVPGPVAPQPVVESVIVPSATSAPASDKNALVEAEALMSLIAMSLPSLRTEDVVAAQSPIVMTDDEQPSYANSQKPGRAAPFHVPAPKRPNQIVLPERDVIAQRVASFRARQQTLIRQRDDRNATVQAKIRAILGNDPPA